MRFRCERDTFVEGLSVAGRAVSSRGAATPVQTCLLAELVGERLRLTGVDGDSDLVMTSEVVVASFEDGSSLLPARLVTDIVRSFDPGAVTVETHDDGVGLSSGRSQFSVRTPPVEEFPKLVAVDDEGDLVDGTALGEALRQVVRAASSDTSRGAYAGVQLAADGRDLRLAATDTYRLAVRDVSNTPVLREGHRVVIPAKALAELQRLLASWSDSAREVRFHGGESFVTFDVGPARITTRILSGDFPDYQHLLQAQYPHRLSVGKEAFIDAVRRMRLVVRDELTPVRVTMSQEAITLSASSPDLGNASEDVEAKYDGAELTIAFNPTFLIEGIEAVSGDELVVDTADPAKPALLRSAERDDFRYLLMPVRIS